MRVQAAFALASFVLASVGRAALAAEPGLERPPERWDVEDFACPAETEVRRAESPDGKYSALWCQLERGGRVARHGPYVELFADGTTLRQGLYLRGVQAGRWVRWSESGEIVTDRTILPGEAGRHLLQPEDLCPPGTVRNRYRSHSDMSYLESDCLLESEDGDEVLHGPSVDWEEVRDERGVRYALREISNYRRGTRHGRHMIFAGPGGRESLVVEETYVDGALDGESRAYFLDGSLRERRRFERGQLRGTRIAFYPDGRERWRAAYDRSGAMTAEGDLAVAGEPCPERTLPETSADGASVYCVRGTGGYGVRDGPYAIRDETGTVVERGLYDDGTKTEIWDGPPGVEPPQQVSEDVLVAVAQLLADGKPYLLPASPDERAPEALAEAEEESIETAAADPFDVWFSSLDSGEYVYPRTEVDDGRVRVYGLAPGRYYMQIRIDADRTNPELYPGDLMASAEFTARRAEIATFEVDLLYTLHLLSPWDNAEHIPGMERRCDEYEATPSPVGLAWAPPPLEDLRGIEYSYTLWSKSCEPHGRDEKLLDGSTFDTELEVDLPASPRARFYQLWLSARRGGRPIGQIMTFGADGSYGWSLIFRVAG